MIFCENHIQYSEYGISWEPVAYDTTGLSNTLYNRWFGYIVSPTETIIINRFYYILRLDNYYSGHLINVNNVSYGHIKGGIYTPYMHEINYILFLNIEII